MRGRTAPLAASARGGYSEFLPPLQGADIPNFYRLCKGRDVPNFYRLCKGRNVPNFYRLCKGRNVPNSDKKGGKKYPPFVFFHIQSDQFSALS